MGTEAYLICDDTREAYYLGKFLGTWAPIDWTHTDVDTLVERIKAQLRSEWSDECYLRTRALWRWCEKNAWHVRVVESDFFFDDADLDVRRMKNGKPLYHQVGDWADDG